MKKIIALFLSSVATAAIGANNHEIVSTSAYSWVGDTIIQGEYRAYAPSPTHIVSTYSAQPHFFMPIDKEWKLKNDIAPYPQLHTSNTLLNAVYNMGLDEMINAVEPDTTLRTGKEWAGVWTRDVSYSIILSMAYMQPVASEVSLRKKVNSRGCIVQDTGSGGAWPISTDRMIWAVAAYELYKVTGDHSWLEYAYPIIQRSMEEDLFVVYTDYDVTDSSVRELLLPQPGVARGETSFIDWREQSYPKWMQCADIYRSEAMGTNMVHAIALKVLAAMAADLGKKDEQARYTALAEQLSNNIDQKFWMADKGYYGMYTYGRDFLILNPRAETLGESLSILYNVASPEKQRSITENNPTTPFGAAIFYPQISDMPSYHNNALWPWVGSMWALANAKVGNELGTLQAIGAVVRPAALFCTNKENFNLDNGDIATELNSSNMLWCLAGNLALTYRILFGIYFEENGLEFKPFVPKSLADNRRLTNFRYRNSTLDITVEGYGSQIKSFKLDGKDHSPILPTKIKGKHKVEIVMANDEVEAMKVNEQPNKKSPITPIARLSNNPEYDAVGLPINNEFSWNPIEYIDYYIVLRDGKEVARTTSTSHIAIDRGEWQVIGVSSDGIQSFASEPLSNQWATRVEMPLEKNSLLSKELSYQPRTETITGYHGEGFVEVDHETKALNFDMEVNESGTYALTLTYANGNGPVNTENKCAIRTVYIDDQRAGIVVMPTRGVGNWSDWGQTNPVVTKLAKGKHKISVRFLPENENMNISTNHAIIDQATLSLMKAQ